MMASTTHLIIGKGSNSKLPDNGNEPENDKKLLAVFGHDPYY
jgi:hypothetical protein